jgi:cell division protein FtsW
MVFSSSYAFAGRSYLKTQSTWLALGVAAMLLMSRVPYWRLRRHARFFLFLAVLLLVAVYLVGVEAGGARRWLQVGPVRLQPSEFAKIATILFLAWLVTERRNRLREFNRVVWPGTLVLGLVCALTAIEPDMGTAVTIFLAGLTVLFIGGAPLQHIIPVAVGAFALGIAAVRSTEYQWERVIAWLNPDAASEAATYQVKHCVIAIGSGGLFGRGLGSGTEKLCYLPAPHTDSIFAVVGEELGLAGTLAVILVLWWLARQGFAVATQARDPFAAVVAAGIVAAITIQAALNIAVVTRSIPCTGLPLPFLSAGGSSLVVLMGAIGIVLNISANVDRLPDYR